MAKQSKQLPGEENVIGPVECLGMKFANDEQRRAYFRTRLQAKLQDAEFRKIAGFPNGSDEDILALSDPPYHTACPNPFLADFIARHGTPDDSALPDRHRAAVFGDVSIARHDHYTLGHTYHTKVSPLAIAQYIQHFTQPGDLVLDLFCGSGMTGLAALGTPVDSEQRRLCANQPRNVILLDLSPAATHIAAGHLARFTLAELDAVGELIASCRNEDAGLFRVPHRGGSTDRLRGWRSTDSGSGGDSANLEYLVWSEILLCPACRYEVVFGEAAYDHARRCVAGELLCPRCGLAFAKGAGERKYSTVHDPLLGTHVRFPARKPIFTAYDSGGIRYYRRPLPEDGREDVPNLSYCPSPAPVLRGERYHKDALAGIYGVSHVHHFYLPRQLQALGRLFHTARGALDRPRRLMQFMLTSIAIKASRLMNYNADGVGRVMKGTLYQSSLIQECNPYWLLDIARRDLRRLIQATRHQPGRALLSTQSSTTLPLPDGSIDYIWTDPPFGKNLMYAELNQLWEWWLGVSTADGCESVIDERRSKDLSSYREAMTRSFKECYRVLKPGRWITIEFHNSQQAVWVALQEALAEAGLVIADVRTLDKRLQTWKQSQQGLVKVDLIISAYRPVVRVEQKLRPAVQGEEPAWDFVRAHLGQVPLLVPEASRERSDFMLFDRMVAWFVRRSIPVPLSSVDFYAGLRQRFVEIDSMFFLPEQTDEYTRHKEATSARLLGA